MTDRIEELRALIAAEKAAHDGGELLSWANAADILRGALYDDCDALLDCAEALRALLSYTKACEELLNAMPAGQVRMAEEALAKLNGGDHAG